MLILSSYGLLLVMQAKPKHIQDRNQSFCVCFLLGICLGFFVPYFLNRRQASDQNKGGSIMAKDYTELAQDIVAHVGGKENITKPVHCDAFTFFVEG